ARSPRASPASAYSRPQRQPAAVSTPTLLHVQPQLVILRVPALPPYPQVRLRRVVPVPGATTQVHHPRQHPLTPPRRACRRSPAAPSRSAAPPALGVAAAAPAPGTRARAPPSPHGPAMAAARRTRRTRAGRTRPGAPRSPQPLARYAHERQPRLDLLHHDLLRRVQVDRLRRHDAA